MLANAVKVIANEADKTINALYAIAQRLEVCSLTSEQLLLAGFFHNSRNVWFLPVLEIQGRISRHGGLVTISHTELPWLDGRRRGVLQ